jgi:hypothetical protein
MSERILTEIRDLLAEINEREKKRDIEYEKRAKDSREMIEQTTKRFRDDLEHTAKDLKSSPIPPDVKEMIELAKKFQAERDRERESFRREG